VTQATAKAAHFEQSGTVRTVKNLSSSCLSTPTRIITLLTIGEITDQLLLLLFGLSNLLPSTFTRIPLLNYFQAVSNFSHPKKDEEEKDEYTE